MKIAIILGWTGLVLGIAAAVYILGILADLITDWLNG
jgi:hypothetical protein